MKSRAFRLIVFSATVILVAAAFGYGRAAMLQHQVSQSDSHVIFTSVNNSVNMYREDGFGMLGRITDGVNGAKGLAVDRNGTLYVANQRGANVSVYTAGSKHPSSFITQGLSHPTAVGVAASGETYVGDLSGVVEIYAAGGGAPIGSFPVVGSGSYGPDIPTDIAVDHAGNVFVAYYFNWYRGGEYVYEYLHGELPPSYLYPTAPDTGGLGIDVVRHGSIIFATPGSDTGGGCVCTAPYRSGGTFGKFYSGNPSPIWVKLDERENRAFVIDTILHDLIIFDYPSGERIRSIEHVGDVDGLAVSPANVL